MAVTACNYLKNVLQYIKEKLMQKEVIYDKSATFNVYNCGEKRQFFKNRGSDVYFAQRGDETNRFFGRKARRYSFQAHESRTSTHRRGAKRT